jgi:hypothetical protein
LPPPIWDPAGSSFLAFIFLLVALGGLFVFVLAPTVLDLMLIFRPIVDIALAFIFFFITVFILIVFILAITVFPFVLVVVGLCVSGPNGRQITPNNSKNS